MSVEENLMNCYGYNKGDTGVLEHKYVLKYYIHIYSKILIKFMYIKDKINLIKDFS